MIDSTKTRPKTTTTQSRIDYPFQIKNLVYSSQTYGGNLFHFVSPVAYYQNTDVFG